MVWPFDAIVQSLFWNIFRVWHGGTISQTKTIDWPKFVVWFFGESFDGRGRAFARLGSASCLACHTHIDGRDLGARVWTWRIGGGKVAASQW
jgi:hypothetical protein